MNARRCLALIAVLLAGTAVAHSPGNSYLALDLGGEHVTGRWDIALRDLDYAVGIDADGDRAVTWSEVLAAAPRTDAYALSALRVTANGTPCSVLVSERRIARHADGAYLAMMLDTGCSSTARLELEYALMFELDRQHRGLLSVTRPSGVSNHALGPGSGRLNLDNGRTSDWREFMQFLREGVWHIWIGFDHVLFVLCLVMPAVLKRDASGWRARETLGPAVANVAGVVTAFTLAHSLTLALAAYGIVRLPTVVVESAIAASIIVVALNNIWPVFRANLLLIAFGFGLVHGLGFASVLQGLAVGASSHLAALVGFNLGVELGQLAIVGVWLPLAFWARRTAAYRKLVVCAGSAIIALVAAYWLLERSLGIAF